MLNETSDSVPTASKSDKYFTYSMSNERNLEDIGLGAPPKKGVYRELRANPYLFGLSAVSTTFVTTAHSKLMRCQVRFAWRLPVWL